TQPSPSSSSQQLSFKIAPLTPAANQRQNNHELWPLSHLLTTKIHRQTLVKSVAEQHENHPETVAQMLPLSPRNGLEAVPKTISAKL
ncbi:hypothetical protein A4A49_64810, partial [Nicotiana attenuata]